MEFTATVFVDNFSFCPLPVGCPDLDGNGVVEVDDLVAVITSWGACPAPPGTCAADVNRDGLVNVDDLIGVITSWGPCG